MSLNRSTTGGAFDLDSYIQREKLPMLALLVAAVQHSEEGQRYASEHDTPSTGRKPSLFIRHKPKGRRYCILDSDFEGMVYVSLPVENFFTAKYRFPKTDEEGRALDILVQFQELTSEELLQKISELRPDKDAGSRSFIYMVGDAYDEIDEYFEPVVDMTYEQAREKYSAVIVS